MASGSWSVVSIGAILTCFLFAWFECFAATELVKKKKIKFEDRRRIRRFKKEKNLEEAEEDGYI